MVDSFLFRLWNLLGSTQATTLATLALLVITGTYVLLTRKIAKAALLQAESLNRPVIVASIDVSSQGLVTLVLKNTGRSAATEIRLSVDHDFFCFGESRNLKEFPAFTGQPFAMGPSDAIRFALGIGHSLFKVAERTPPRFNITASYRFGSTSYLETLPVDLTPYYESLVPKSEFAIEMEKLRKAIAQRR